MFNPVDVYYSGTLLCHPTEITSTVWIYPLHLYFYFDMLHFIQFHKKTSPGILFINAELIGAAQEYNR